jgi:hypothetical protein
MYDVREVLRENPDCCFNSWGHVDDVRDLILEGRLRVINGLEHDWQLISQDGNSPSGNQGRPRDLNHTLTNTPAHALTNYMEMGTYPLPEILIALADCITLYLDSHGELELEEVFFGKKTQRLGNFSSKSRSESLCKFFHSYLQNQQEIRSLKLQLNSDEKELRIDKSISDSAEDMFRELDIPGDIDSFLRKYRRWKVKYSIPS